MQQYECMDKLIKNLPVLRATINMTQAQLAEKVGVSRQTIVAIETRKRLMSLTLYLAIVCVFQNHDDSKKMIGNLSLFDESLI